MTMKNEMNAQHYEIGMVGLGVMGRNLVLNMADHGFPVAGYDKDEAKVKAMRQEAGQRGRQRAWRRNTVVGALRLLGRGG